MNTSTRRALLTIFMALPFVRCTNVLGGTSPPTLAQIQAWASSIQADLPTFISTAQMSGALSASQLASVTAATPDVNTALDAVISLKPGAVNAKTVIADLGTALQLLVSFIPGAAPYALLINMLIALAAGFVTSQPAAVAGVPVPPAPPAQSAVHAAAMARKGTN